MSYEPLHHKYRPKSFAELVGQEAIATTLTNAISLVKIAPAYLFTGPRGTGKTSSARILAKSLNCLQGGHPTPTPCGVCDICQSITKGYSLDVIEIDAASNTGVDNIRELIEKAQFAPVQCRYKVYVIDECHMLSTAAFNALLKTLEEPPKHVVFVLATTDPQRVLPTIISRCQRFDFRRIQLEAMVKHLSKIAHNENIPISQDAITLVAQISQGGLRDAESLLDQLALLPGEVSPEQVWDLVGSVSEKDLFTLLQAIAQNKSEKVLDHTRKILDRGREPLIILQNLGAFYRDLLIAKTASSRQDLVSCTQETWQQLVNFATELDITFILRGQQQLRTAEAQLKSTTQPRLWLEVTLLGLLPITQNSMVAPSTPSVHLGNIQNQNGTNHNVSPSHVYRQDYQQANPPTHNSQHSHHYPEQATSSSSEALPNGSDKTPHITRQEIPPSSEHDLNQIWYQVLANLQPASRREMLRQMSQLLEFDGNLAKIGIKQAWYEKGKSDLGIIQNAFHQTFQRHIQIQLEKTNSSPATTTRRNSIPEDSTRVYQPVPQPIPSPKIETVDTIVDNPVDNPASNPPLVNKLTPNPSTPSHPHNRESDSRVTTNQLPTSNGSVFNQDESQVAKAAKSLAEFFSGQITQLTDDNFDLAGIGASMDSDLEVYNLDDYEY
ncbi:DNA polymerase III subunit gamma/tau [Cylindrospermopsis raciborskii]|uniref:DNA polymerase III subunit gamma/tau n=1 Tax=Cylindrospermopsis raciborskii TaxID=77022 RepID=UPI000C1B92B1|nr:DNA polymerase III subunit gamma/tau [Cylindrospermopsis raciborskii]MCZ2207218.1 DNA polymerase III subunit gamma/tau [Cylindrospermopsis raciborskii PAMP2011]